MTATRLSKPINKTLLLLLFPLLSAYGQTVPTLEDYRKSCNNCNELVLSDKCSYDITVDKGKLSVMQDNYYESVILSESAISNNDESFSYSDMVRLKGYDAFSIITDRGKERKVKVTQSNEKMRTDKSVFFDDVKERQLIFPNLQMGARKVYSVKKEFSDPFLLQSYFFGGSLPVNDATLEIQADKDISIGYKIFNDPNQKVVFSKTEKKNKWIYSWTLKDNKAFKFEPNNPGFRYILPHINIYVSEYQSGGQHIKVLGDTDKLYGYYKTFVKGLNRSEDAPLKELTTEITNGAASDAEKMKRIFYWVKDHIKYIAFENGYEGFIPREAAVVFERKFGDCKDMANLIRTMGHYAGVEKVALCWIGTREIPYGYTELSTPAVDNHMIAVFDDNGTNVFLDATDRETMYGMPTAFIQEKQALIGQGDMYKIINVPTTPANGNKISSEMEINLEGDKIVGKGSLEFLGYSRSRRLGELGDASGQERNEMIRHLAQVGSNKFNLKNFHESNTDNRDLPYRIDYDFDLRDYALKIEDDTYIDIVLDPIFANADIEDDRESAYDFDYLVAFEGKTTFHLPKDSKVKSLPKDLSLDNDLLHVDLKYTKTPADVVMNLSITTKKILIQQADFKLWNATIRQLKDSYAETLILSKK